jgi:inner membrane transporter RhtA
VSRRRQLDRPPALALVATGAVSVQFGAALATRLFDRVGPAGAVTLRLVIAALLLSIPFLLRGPRPALAGKRARDVQVAVLFGLALAGMNLSFYEAIERIPLGVAVTVEFSGPLALALIGSRRLTDAVWAIAAGAGVAFSRRGQETTWIRWGWPWPDWPGWDGSHTSC